MTLRWISSCSENVHENARKGWFWSTYSSCSCVIMLKYFVKKELWNCQTGWKTAELGCLQMTIHSISGFDLIKNTIIANAPKCIEQQLRKLYQIFYENRTEKGQVILKPQSNWLGQSRIQGYNDAIQCQKIPSIKQLCIHAASSGSRLCGGMRAALLLSFSTCAHIFVWNFWISYRILPN